MCWKTVYLVLENCISSVARLYLSMLWCSLVTCYLSSYLNTRGCCVWFWCLASTLSCTAIIGLSLVPSLSVAVGGSRSPGCTLPSCCNWMLKPRHCELPPWPAVACWLLRLNIPLAPPPGWSWRRSGGSPTSPSPMWWQGGGRYPHSAGSGGSVPPRRALSPHWCFSPSGGQESLHRGWCLPAPVEILSGNTTWWTCSIPSGLHRGRSCPVPWGAWSQAADITAHAGCTAPLKFSSSQNM